MSEIVKNELDAIKAFETGTEKRRSELTLNELNYISDKQLHKKGGGTGGDVLIIDPKENNSVTIDGVAYNLITFVPHNTENFSFILVDPSVLTSPQVIYFYDSVNQSYELATQCGIMQTGTISSDDVSTDNIYPTSPITAWYYVPASMEAPYFLIPNNATYAVGTYDGR